MNDFLNEVNGDVNIILGEIDNDLNNNLDKVKASMKMYYSENNIQEKAVSFENVDKLILNFVSIYKGLGLIKRYIDFVEGKDNFVSIYKGLDLIKKHTNSVEEKNNRTEELIKWTEDLYELARGFLLENKNSYLNYVMQIKNMEKEDISKSNKKRKENPILLEREEFSDNIKKKETYKGKIRKM